MSLRARIASAAVAAILTAVLLFGVAAEALTAHELRGSLDRSLRRGAADIGRLSGSAPDVLTTPGALDAPAQGRQLLIEVLDSRRRIVARSLSLGARLLPIDAAVVAVQRSGRPHYDDLALGSQRLRRYSAPIADDGGPAAGGVVMVASDRSDITAISGRVRTLLLIGGVGAAALAGLLAAVLTRRGLRPLRRLSDAAAEIESTQDATRRLPAMETADEVASLTAVLNRMLAALQSARDVERRFLADASHELRTPVTALLGNVEYAERHGATAEVLADLRHDATRLARLVDQLLALEREAAAPAAGQAVALDEIARAAADGRAELTNATPVTVRGDADALTRALSNLIENGLVHGQGRVRIAVTTDGGHACVSVSDDGPGPEDGERIFERFWRAGDRPGSGLGLSIVASVIARHGGTIAVDGSTFTLRLPIAQHAPS